MDDTRAMTPGRLARKAYRHVDICWPPHPKEWRAIIRRYGLQATLDAHEAYCLLHDDDHGSYDRADETLREARGF